MGQFHNPHSWCHLSFPHNEKIYGKNDNEEKWNDWEKEKKIYIAIKGVYVQAWISLFD